MSKEKKIYVVGIGPGSYEGMTGAAATALEKSDVIVRYTVYIDLVKDHFPGKSFLTTPMRKEVDRCVMAFDEAMKDQTVSMICSGDAEFTEWLVLCMKSAQTIRRWSWK